MFDTSTAHHAADSFIDWWTLAGLETLASETACNWLAAPAAPSANQEQSTAKPIRTPLPAILTRPQAEPAEPSPAMQPALSPLEMPGEWDAFQQWLATGDRVPGSSWHQHRILPSGSQGARLMILSLTPEIEDQENGHLHSGAPGRLLDAMLRSIGLMRDNCYLSSLALTRPPGGRLDNSSLAALVPLLWHHLRLAQPGHLLLFGSDLAQLVAATDLAAARGKLLNINQDGVKVEAVAIQHPLLLLDRPTRKAAAWDSLKRLAQG